MALRILRRKKSLEYIGMMKKIITIIFLSSLETIVFAVLHDYFFNELFPTRNIGMLNWGISLQIAFIEFIIFAIILNTFLDIYTRVKPIWAIGAATVLYSVTWLTDLFNTPTLATKLLVS